MHVKSSALRVGVKILHNTLITRNRVKCVIQSTVLGKLSLIGKTVSI